MIAGTPDPANPTSVTEEEATGWNDEPGITWLGRVDGIGSLWARAHIAVLPSRREGLPKSLLEAAACGRPLVATDVPGCREIVRHEETGLLVPFGDVEALADRIGTLARAPDQRARYGRGGAAAGCRAVSLQPRSVGRRLISIAASADKAARGIRALRAVLAIAYHET